MKEPDTLVYYYMVFISSVFNLVHVMQWYLLNWNDGSFQNINVRWAWISIWNSVHFAALQVLYFGRHAPVYSPSEAVVTLGS